MFEASGCLKLCCLSIVLSALNFLLIDVPSSALTCLLEDINLIHCVVLLDCVVCLIGKKAVLVVCVLYC